MGKNSSRGRYREEDMVQSECFKRAKSEVDALLHGLPPEQQLKLLHEQVNHEARGVRHRDENASGRHKPMRRLWLFPWTEEESTADAITYHRKALSFQKMNACNEKSITH